MSEDKNAKRFNEEKVDLSLLPEIACLEECKVWMFGEKKYGRDNWKKLWGEQTINTATASLLRHAMRLTSGELLDEESGLPHAAHIRCNAAMILEYMARSEEKITVQSNTGADVQRLPGGGGIAWHTITNNGGKL